MIYHKQRAYPLFRVCSLRLPPNARASQPKGRARTPYPHCLKHMFKLKCSRGAGVQTSRRVSRIQRGQGVTSSVVVGISDTAFKKVYSSAIQAGHCGSIGCLTLKP